MTDPPGICAGPAPTGPGRRHNVPVQLAPETSAAPAPDRVSLVGGVALPTLGVLALAGSVWLDVTAPSTGPGVELAEGPGWPYVAHGVVLTLLAAVVLLRSSARLLGLLIGLNGLFWALDGLSQSYVLAGVSADSAWPGMTFALWFLNRFGAFLPVAIAVLLLVFPTGRFLAGGWGVLGRAALGVAVLAGLVILVVPAEGRLTTDMIPPDVDVDPTSLDLLRGHSEAAVTGAVAVGSAAFLVTLLLVVVRYRQSTGLMRDRMRWLLWSVFAIVAGLLVTLVVSPPGTDYVVTTVVMVLPAGAMTVAVVQPTLVPIGDLLGRTVVLATVLAVIVAADVLVLAVLTALLDGLTEAQIVAVVLVVAVALYGPLRQRLSAAVRRRMLGDRGNPYDALAGLASMLETTDDAGEQLAAVARAVATAFGVGFVSLEVDWTTGDRMVTTYGERPAQVRSLPITYRGAAVGRLVLPARGVRSRLTARDEQLLGDLVRQAATAARTSQLAEEVQQSRERLVTAREEERRRIRRDLHDGLGPALSGVVFQLEAARMTVDRDPEQAKDQLDGISRHVQGVVADVRRLVHDLRPPALDDRGLVGALRQQADRLDVPLTVDAPDLDGRLPAAVEVAAYRIVGEALTNVARHADATAARLHLSVGDDTLLVELADDGVGIDPDRQAGVGLVSLRERAAELGGRAAITCPPDGGTVVRAWLPLRSEA